MAKLSISNLAINPLASIGDTISFLEANGISGIEVAPTRYWGALDQLNWAEVDRFSRGLQSAGFSVSGLQSLMFNRPDLNLFDRNSWADLRKHFMLLIELSNRVGAEILVFGSPKNRRRGSLNKLDADYLAKEFFESIDEQLVKSSVTLTIEPNSWNYDCDWINTYEESVAFAKFMNSPSLAPQIDTGSQVSQGENVIHAFQNHLPAHIHISELNLGQITEGANHSSFGKQIQNSVYRGWVVLEMLFPPTSSDLCDLLSLANFKGAYASESICL
jgi:D-psicose/D-tagatose/L-ribulose 3-epimerase